MTSKERISIHCIHEEDWGEIKSAVLDMKKDIDGNGKKGLRDAVTELTVSTDSLKSTIHDTQIIISGLVKFQNEMEAITKSWQRNTMVWLMVIGLIFTGINVFFGILSKSSQREHPQTIIMRGSQVDTVSSLYFEE